MFTKFYILNFENNEEYIGHWLYTYTMMYFFIYFLYIYKNIF